MNSSRISRAELARSLRHLLFVQRLTPSARWWKLNSLVDGIVRGFGGGVEDIGMKVRLLARSGFEEMARVLEQDPELYDQRARAGMREISGTMD